MSIILPSFFSFFLLLFAGLFAINPGATYSQARNSERESEINQIASAIVQWTIDGGEISTLRTIEGKPISTCVLGMNSGTNILSGEDMTMLDAVDLDPILSDIYLPAIPSDPEIAYGEYTGYDICIESSSGKFTIIAPAAEEGKTIKVTK